MYINFWYPIIRSEDLGPDKPERAKVLGVNFVVFRDQEGRARVLSDTCVHRGGSLGGAWELGQNPRVVNGCVVCPYHGWEYNGEGECTNIPSIGYGKKPPARAKVDAYPVQEKYGIVFAFLGDLPESERPRFWKSRNTPTRPGGPTASSSSTSTTTTSGPSKTVSTRTQRVRPSDARLPGDQPGDLQRAGLRRGRLSPGLGHVVPAPLQRTAAEGDTWKEARRGRRAVRRQRHHGRTR